MFRYRKERKEENVRILPSFGLQRKEKGKMGVLKLYSLKRSYNNTFKFGKCLLHTLAHNADILFLHQQFNLENGKMFISHIKGTNVILAIN